MNTAPKAVRLAECERLSNMIDEQDVYLLALGMNGRDVVLWKGSILDLGDVKSAPIELVT